MSDSDSEDSFHSVENADDELRQRDQDVLEEEAEAEISPSVTPTSSLKEASATSIPSKTQEDDLSWSDRIDSDLDLDRLLLNETSKLPKTQDDQHESFSTLKTEKKPSFSDVSKTIRPTWPVYVEPEEMEDSFIHQSSVSSPDTPSEPSTDRESGNEMKEWDRLSAEDSSSSSEKTSKQEIDVNQNLLDEWERGWEDADLSDQDIAKAMAEPAKKPSVSATTPAVSVSAKKVTESTIVPPKKSVPSEDVKLHNNDQAQSAAGSGLWGKWGGWGTNLLTTAVGQVGQGLNVVMETVEQSLGAPKPEELAAMKNSPDEEKVKAPVNSDPARQRATTSEPPVESVSGWLSGFTTKVQSGGLSLVSNSLDVLEGLGKKTMEVVSEKDPGLKQTRAVLTGKLNQPILSQVLREAKATRFDTGDQRTAGKREEQASFVHFFDEEQGTGSWEALELFSSQCAQRLESQDLMLADSLKHDLVEKVEHFCQAADYEDSPRDGDIGQLIRREYGRLNLGLPEPHSLLHVFRVAEEFLKDNAKAPAMDFGLWRRNVHRSGVHTFAASTAKSLEQIRKTAEMIFLNSANGKQDTAVLLRRIESVHVIVCSVCQQMDKFAHAYAACLALAAQDDATAESSKKTSSASSQISDLFVEASNSNRYIQDGLALCLPIFKLALLSETSYK